MISFTKTTPEKAAAIVAKLEGRRKDAVAELELARELYGEASLAVEEGAPNATSAKDKALKDIRKAESEIAEIDATLSAARTRHAEAIKVQQAEQADIKWKEVKEIGMKRHELALQIEADAKRLAKNMEKLIKLGLQQFETAPKKDVGFNSSSLAPNELITALRQFLFKQGQTWAFRWPWGTTEIPDFTSRVAEGTNWLMAQRDRSERRAALENA